MTIAVISMIRDAWGGSEELWHDMAKAALRDGHRVIHLSYEHPGIHPKMASLEQEGLVRLRRPGYIAPGGPVKQLLQLGRNFVRKKIKNPLAPLFALDPDIILYNGTCYSIGLEKELLARLPAFCKQAGKKFYILGHLNSDLGPDIPGHLMQSVKQAYRLAHTVFFVSARSMQIAKRHLCDPLPSAAIIRNPVNLASVEALPYPGYDKGVSLAMVGNLNIQHKGQDLMLEALSRSSYTGWRLNIYGSGPDRSYLEELAAYLGIRDKVRFHGTVSDIRKVWAENHLLLMPSHMEGMPLAVVEAQLCGRPCLVTDVGGHAEWILDGRNGYLAAGATTSSLHASLEQAFAQRSEWEKMGQQGHQKASALYDPQAGKTLLHRIIAG